MASFAVLAALKAMLIAVYGPLIHPDTSGYLDYAGLMLDGGAWLHAVDLETLAKPPEVLRTVGYPALIAAAKVLGVAGSAYLVIGLQSVLSLLASYAVYRLALTLARGLPWALLAALLYSTSMILTYDVSLLSDSLFTNLTVIVVATLAIDYATAVPAGARRLIGLGAIFTVALLMRDAGRYILPLLMLLAAMGAYRDRPVVWLAVRAGAAFALPAVVVLAAYMAWNQYRAGDTFVTTGGQTVYLNAVVGMAEWAEVFGGTTPLDRVARELVHRFDQREALDIGRALHQRHGLTAPEIASLAFARYRATVVRHPLAFIRYVGGELNLKLVFMLANPLASFEELHRLATGQRLDGPVSLWRELAREFSLTGALRLVGHVAGRAASAVLFLAFFIAVPVSVLRAAARRRMVGEMALLAWLWLFYTGAILMHAAVYLELRYVMFAVPGAVVGGLWALSRTATAKTPQGGAAR